MFIQKGKAAVVPFDLEKLDGSPGTDTTPAVFVGKADGKGFGSGPSSATVTERGDGAWEVALTSVDTSVLGALALKVIADGCKTRHVHGIQIVAFDPMDAKNLGLSDLKDVTLLVRTGLVSWSSFIIDEHPERDEFLTALPATNPDPDFFLDYDIEMQSGETAGEVRPIISSDSTLPNYGGTYLKLGDGGLTRAPKKGDTFELKAR